MRCRHCHQGVQVGANQCVKGAKGRNLHVVDHQAGDEITIEAADVEDFLEAVQIVQRTGTR